MSERAPVSSATHFARAMYGAGTMPSRSHSSANVSSSHLNEHRHVRIVGEVRARHGEHLAANLEDRIHAPLDLLGGAGLSEAELAESFQGHGRMLQANPPCRDDFASPCSRRPRGGGIGTLGASQPASPAGPLRFEMSYPASRSDSRSTAACC